MRAMKLGAAVAAILTSVCAGSAFADGLPPPPSYPPAYPPVYAPAISYDWTGIYIGGQVGGAYSRIEWTNDLTLDQLEHLHTGFSGGGFAGIQKQWSWFVLGAEVSYLWMDQPESSGAGIVPDITLRSNVRNLLLVSGKFGWTWENMLAYFKGGYAMGDVDFRANTTSTGALLTSSTSRENGWTAGAGLDYALRENIIIGVEYNYVEFNTGVRTQVPAAGGPPGTHADAGVDVQTLMARLSFKLGGGGLHQ